MWSAEGDGSVKGDQEMTNILNSLKKCWIRILQPVEIALECKVAARLTLTQDTNFRSLGIPIGTIPIMLNTSIQNNPYNPPKNFFKLPNTNTH